MYQKSTLIQNCGTSKESDITSKSLLLGHRVILNTVVNDSVFLTANPSNVSG